MNKTLKRFFIPAAAALALAAPAAANAQSLNSVSVSTDASTDFLVLDVQGGSTSPGAQVIQWYGSGAANQRFNFVQQPDGNELIVNQKSGMCLTGGSAGEGVYQWYCNGDAHQEWSGWIPNKFGAGFFNGKPLTNAATGLRMDIEGGSNRAGARLITWYSNGGVNQHFAYYQLG